MQTTTPLTDRPRAGLLRFAAIGSVDDGKSTLIGRLLHDTRSIADDQLAAVADVSRRRGGDRLDLSLLTDGLRAEREQGITIDVAYRYFASGQRSFVIADTPGHVQYTRNMVTGCSTAEAAVVLVDARHGPGEQTRRHVAIAGLLRVPHLLVCVNKMDLVGWDEATHRSISDEVAAIAALAGVAQTASIPVSALHGDNVVDASPRMPWYDGRTLLEHLEAIDPAPAGHDAPFRLPVQSVIRDPSRHGHRAYAGRIEAGRIRAGDRVLALPGGIETTVQSIETLDGELEAASAPASVAVTLAHDIDLGRGGMLADPADAPEERSELDVLVCWLGREPMRVGARYWIHHTTRTARAVVEDMVERLDVATLQPEVGAEELVANDIGRATLRLSAPLFVDSYPRSRSTGSAILIDEVTHETVAALLISGPGAREDGAVLRGEDAA